MSAEKYMLCESKRLHGGYDLFCHYNFFPLSLKIYTPVNNLKIQPLQFRP